MDPIKIVIFLAAFALLLFIGRLLSRSSEIRGGMPSGTSSVPQSRPVGPPAPEPELIYAEKRHPAATGRELGFPIKLPPVTHAGDGKFNRPEFVNYFFKKIDMVTGPADPESFFDEFYLEAQDPASGHSWTYEYTVASPAGLTEIMRAERFESLYFDAPLLIVSRWDLKVILYTVTEEIMKTYGLAAGGTAEEPAATT